MDGRSVNIGTVVINEVSDGVCVINGQFRYVVVCNNRDEVFSKLRSLEHAFNKSRVAIGKYIKDLVYDLDSEDISGVVNEIVWDGIGFMVIGSEVYVNTDGLIFNGIWTSFGGMGTQSLNRLSGVVLSVIRVLLRAYQRVILDELYSILCDEGLKEALEGYLYGIKDLVVIG